jgi:hypothetical protein
VISRLYISFVALFLLLAGCQLDGLDVGPITNDNKQLFLKEIVDGKEIRANFVYDSDFRLVSQTFYQDRVYRYEFDYTDSQHPEKIKVFFDDLHRYNIKLKYEDDKLVESKAVTPNIERLLFLERYKYDELNKMVRRDVFPGILGAFTQVDYTWENNNVTEVNAAFIDSQEKIVYDYDDRLNPFIEVYRNIGYDHHNSQPISSNNWSNRLLTSTAFGPGDTETGKSLYSYIVPGYPFYVATETEDRFGRKFEAELTYKY